MSQNGSKARTDLFIQKRHLVSGQDVEEAFDIMTTRGSVSTSYS